MCKSRGKRYNDRSIGLAQIIPRFVLVYVALPWHGRQRRARVRLRQDNYPSKIKSTASRQSLRHLVERARIQSSVALFLIIKQSARSLVIFRSFLRLEEELSFCSFTIWLFFNQFLSFCRFFLSWRTTPSLKQIAWTDPSSSSTMKTHLAAHTERGGEKKEKNMLPCHRATY